MKTSVAMDEIRTIRDANSLRHMTMSKEEISIELKQSMDWFTAEIEKIRSKKQE